MIIMMAIVLSACGSRLNLTLMNTNSIFPKGSALPREWFTGNAFVIPLVAKDKNNDFTAGAVTFEPGARTNWHTHPRGQVLLIIEGTGLYQEKGGHARVIRQGDIVIIRENTEHWHVATCTEQMVHIANTNFIDETQVTWLSPVSEEEYRAAERI